MVHGMLVKMKQYSTLWPGCRSVMTKQKSGYYVVLVSCSGVWTRHCEWDNRGSSVCVYFTDTD